MNGPFMDLSTIGFRPMTEADLPAVDAIEQAVQPYPWRISQFADSLKAGHQAWIFTEAGQPFGYAVLLAALDEVELLTLALARSHQGRGLGRHCLGWLQAQVRQQGGRSLFLEVATANAPALGLYQRMGFETLGRRRNYYRAADGRHDDAWVMRCPLEPTK